ncbi:hypothetical protein [Xenorhabdus budapestensis]|uniref:Uncharacterized protein n=1 Tax=Xenorhabdus budapestensis TaxID=290110 RepID=A0A2D0ISE5_XENBU|nr:hypothetical protein [Xenorhabdus budapestensis]PHM24776.1 hypothetical protein Xbud_03231 [Xenorhabdus budapestensis]QTL38474.1 hypothetical protein HGO23_11165 [Xenorhabdus budapestensis]
MKSLYDVTLAPPTFPQADGTGTIYIHNLQAMENEFIIMYVPHYPDADVGDEIIGYLCLHGDCSNSENGAVIKSSSYYMTPDRVDLPPYVLLFHINEISIYGKFQAHYKVISRGNVNESQRVNINLTYSDISSLSSYIPRAPDATGNQGNLLTKDDYYKLDRLRIDVPVYDGMASGQVVNVQWQGRKGIIYSTLPQTVYEVMPMTFYIPRMEFIDTIGNTAKVQFKVEKLVNNTATYSGILHLEIEGQELNLPAPTLFYRGDSTIHVMIEYSDMSFDQTVEIRAVGKTVLQTHYKQVDDQNQMAVPLPADWIEENRGHLVLIDYAVGSMYPGREYSFSRVLRQIL